MIKLTTYQHLVYTKALPLTGDKPLYEPVMVYNVKAYTRYSASMSKGPSFKVINEYVMVINWLYETYFYGTIHIKLSWVNCIL